MTILEGEKYKLKRLKGKMSHRELKEESTGQLNGEVRDIEKKSVEVCHPKTATPLFHSDEAPLPHLNPYILVGLKVRPVMGSKYKPVALCTYPSDCVGVGISCGQANDRLWLSMSGQRSLATGPEN